MLYVLFFVLSIAAIGYFVFDFLYVKSNPEESHLPSTKLVGIIGLVVFIITLLFSVFLVKVGGQEVAVLVTPSGVNSTELTTGWHFVGPWNKVEYMDKTVWVYTFSNKQEEGAKPSADAIWCPTKDGIKMGFDISISWKISPLEASWIYENISEADGGPESRYRWIEDNIIRPNVASILPLTVSNYTPIEVYSSKRQDIQTAVYKRIASELLETYKLIVTKVDIREVFYNREYEQSITNKKLAEQEALRLIEVTKQREEMLKQETINKDIAIQKAMGESEALKIKGQSITNNPKIIQLEWINKWDGTLPHFMSGSSNGIMFNMNMDNNNK